MTPENRTQMLTVLRESLRSAYLPGGSDAHAHGHDANQHGVRVRDTHQQGGRGTTAVSTESTELAESGQRPAAADVVDRGAAPLTAAGTPATPIDAALDPDALADRFCQELEALAGVAHRAHDAESAAEHIAAILARTGSSAIVGWDVAEIGVPGLAEALAARGVSLATADVPFGGPDRASRLGTLAAISVGLTGAQAAIADSGSLVLASGPGRGRLASLLPPVHVAILHRDRILPSLPDLFRLRPELSTLGSNMVIVTGPSRTGDIEMTLSRGVHGPREVHVIVI